MDKRNEELRTQLDAAMAAGRAGVTMTGAAEEVSSIALDRQEQEPEVSRRAMQIIGREWVMADPVVRRGDRVNAIGVANFTAEGLELREAGPLPENLTATIGAIEAERRTVVPINIRELRLAAGPDGLVMKRVGSGKPGLPVSSSVVESICDYFPEVFSKVKQGLIHEGPAGGMDPDHKVEVFNRLITDRMPRTLDGTRRSGDLAAVVRLQRGAWSMWTVRGAKNTANELDGAEYLKLVRAAVNGSDMYGTVEYQPESGRVAFDGWTMPNHIVDLSAGDVFKAGISGSTNDNKGGKYRILFNVVRNLCHNLIILSHEGAEVFAATHNSKPDRVISGIRDGMNRADDALDGFRDLWGLARARQVPEVCDTRIEDVRAMFRDIAPAVRQPGVDRDTTVEYLLHAWEQEPGYTLADIHNAVSRLHLQRDLDAFEVARAAGELLPVLAQA